MRNATTLQAKPAVSCSPRHRIELEAERDHMIQMVLEIRATCERARSSDSKPDHAVVTQKLLSAAISDLEELDERLYRARLLQAEQ